MEKLEKKKDVLYTQNVTLPTEERVFFSEGLVANVSDYRIASEQEILLYYESKKMEEMNYN